MNPHRTLALLLAAAPVLAEGPVREAPHGPAGSMSAARAGSMSARPAPDAAPEGATRVEGLTFRLPEAWTTRAPSSPMRKAEASIPGPGGEATLTVFHFGPGGGGGVEANLARWEAQLEAAAGASPERRELAGAGTTIHLTALDGTLRPSPMSGVAAPVPGSRLMGAVVEGPGGPWFFKVTGPAMAVRLAMPDFVEMLAGARAD